MSQDYSVGQSSSCVNEKVVEEPEVMCGEQIGQLEQQLRKANFSSRKCQDLHRPRNRVRHVIHRCKMARGRRVKRLKISKVIEKIVSIVNVWRHENFLQVAEKFFRT